ncbi:hypothetical protein LCGC14_3108200 [marine sediment metagenome]|uniref:Recombination endonuclease VII n=1 Tax=marine sediment metagenome TaxID=412755 RepID=A0A0F8YVR1_9ZZZZ
MKTSVKKLESNRRWKEKNKDKARKSVRDWIAKDPEANRLRARSWAAQNRDRSRKKAREWAVANPEKYRTNMRKYKLSGYGLTLDAYNALLVGQSNKCAICKSHSPPNTFLIDHDHSSGAVRGLLCRKCNTGLGMFEDSVETLTLALKYIQRNNGRNI